MLSDILFIVNEILLTMIIGVGISKLILLLLKNLHKIKYLKAKQQQLRPILRQSRHIVLIVTAVFCLVVIIFGVWLIGQQKNVQKTTFDLIISIPPQFWLTLIFGIIKTALLVSLTVISLPYLHYFLDSLCLRIQNFDDIQDNDESIALFFKFFKIHITTIISLIVITLTTEFFEFPDVVSQYSFVGIKIYGIVVLGLLIIKGIIPIFDTLDSLSEKNYQSNKVFSIYRNLADLIPVLKRCIEYQIYICVASLALLQIDVISHLAGYGINVVKIVALVFVAAVIDKVSTIILEDLLFKTYSLTDLQLQRRQTLIPLIKNILKYFIYFGAGIVGLDIVGVNPGPFLAGAGVLGIALGIGAQNLVHDMVCGFFILFENYYLVGDYIAIGAAEGTVDSIDLRTTRLRHWTGKQFIIRNGDVRDIINYSKDYIIAIVEFRISYAANIDQVEKLIIELGKQVKAKYPEQVIEETKVWGPENFGNSDILMRALTKVKPGYQYEIQRLLRRLIKKLFDEQGIEIPFPRQIIIPSSQAQKGNNFWQNDNADEDDQAPYVVRSDTLNARDTETPDDDNL